MTCGREVCATDPVAEEDIIKACVLRVCERGLLVCDLCSLRELLIQTPNAGEFHPGDRIQIRHSATVQARIPQIEANQICRVKKW